MNQAQTPAQQAYVTAYQNVIMAVSDVERYVSPALSMQIDSLEASMAAVEIDRLREVARRCM